MLTEHALEIVPLEHMTEEEFFRFCRKNADLRIERDKNGSISIMPPTGFQTGRRNAKLTAKLDAWNEQQSHGICADSSTGYTLPNGAIRSPDASWISHERLATTTPEDLERFAHITPEFVVEIRSRSDAPRVLREKMEEYIENGVLLAWYIDVPGQFVEVYRADGTVDVVQGFDQSLSGETVLPGFEFDLTWMK